MERESDKGVNADRAKNRGSFGADTAEKVKTCAVTSNAGPNLLNARSVRTEVRNHLSIIIFIV